MNPSELLLEIRNSVAFVTLNRPAALNALSMQMLIELRTAMQDCAIDPAVRAVLLRGAGEKAFCAGGDIRALYQSVTTSGDLHREFFAAEYELDYFLRCYPKPYVALIDGITMGGGMGLAQGSPWRIVGERTRIAMPEVAIGFFPDVGGSFFLSRAPGELGPYLALTGAQIRAADALYTGLADVYMSREAVNRLAAALGEVSWSADARADVEQCIRRLASQGAGSAPLASLQPVIDAHFAAASVPAILQSLGKEQRPEHRDWAQHTAATIKSRSPTLCAATLRQLRRGRSMSFADCLRMELGMTQHCMAHPDFIEGVRATIIDKDNAPQWRPSTLAAVTEASVDAFFDSPGAPGRALDHLERTYGPEGR